jgi:hypothetical protein
VLRKSRQGKHKPPSAMQPSAASMNGAAVPYGSRSTTSTRFVGTRWWYMRALGKPSVIHIAFTSFPNAQPEWD